MKDEFKLVDILNKSEDVEVVRLINNLNFSVIAGGITFDIKGQPEKPKKEKYRSKGFDEFWGLYKKSKGDGKAEAKKAYEKVANSRETEMLICSMAIYFTEKWDREGTEKRFIPMAATWLNKKRFEDECEEDSKDAFEGW